MSSYDYRQGKNRIETILDNYMQIEERKKVPSESSFTFENGYISWVTAIFVDIRNSTEIFSSKSEETAKMVRAFTSEIIEILRNDDNYREIGIRGDCVYAIYTTPKKTDTYECAQKCFYVNTFINMFNKLLKERNIKTIEVGIGMATDKELVVKTGRKGVSINEKVWIGKAVSVASNLSSHGDKNKCKRIFFSKCSYNNIIDILSKNNSSKNVKNWFNYISDYEAYNTGVVKVGFDNWIKNDFID